jgi:transketolase N-terminal domain/subunit
MSAAELVAGTSFYAMKFDPKDPKSPDGDRFVLSKGRAAPVLYAAFAKAGVVLQDGGRKILRPGFTDQRPGAARTTTGRHLVEIKPFARRIHGLYIVVWQV